MPRQALSDLSELRRRIREQGGAPSLLSEESLSSGSSSLDAFLPGGGFPRGAITVLSGPSGSGRKSIAATLVAAETQADRVAAWLDGSGTLYPPALASLGVRLDRLLIVRSEEGAEALRAMHQIIESSAFGVVVASGVERMLTAVRARRIQTASEAAQVCTLMVLEPGAHVPGARLELSCARKEQLIAVEIERCRFGASGRRFQFRASA